MQMSFMPEFSFGRDADLVFPKNTRAGVGQARTRVSKTRSSNLDNWTKVWSTIHPIMRTIFIRAVLLLGALFLLCVAAMAWAMRQPPEKFGRIMSRTPTAAFIFLPFETLWTNARAGDLKPGDAAPDFSLTELNKSAQVQLSSFRGKQPVVLVFGSYT